MNSSALHEYDDPKAVEPAKKFLDKRTKQKVIDELHEIIEEQFRQLEEESEEYISGAATERAVKFIDRVLKGDEKAAESIFSTGESGRRKVFDPGKGEPWCSLIHGKLHETEAVKLRRELVEAHPDLLRNERIADLESIVESLTEQANKSEAELKRIRGF